jgi:hypothetical protein
VHSSRLGFWLTTQRFNAAFNGDLETIKMLTLTSWDDAKEEAPLQIAIRDQEAKSPFWLAFTRGHYNVAKAILEIAQAQYSPEGKPKTRYTMQAAEDGSDDDSGCDESVTSDDARPKIYSHIVDTQFTIDNVGQVSMQVKSRIKPLDIVGWSSPLRSMRDIAPIFCGQC